MDQEKIGRFIAELRKENSLTQKELAEKLSVSDRTVGNWERGQKSTRSFIVRSIMFDIRYNPN